MKITTVSSAIGCLTFFLGMWQLFCHSMMSQKILQVFDMARNSVLSLLTPASPRIPLVLRREVTWPSCADRSPCWPYSCPAKPLFRMLLYPEGHEAAAVARSVAGEPRSLWNRSDDTLCRAVPLCPAGRPAGRMPRQRPADTAMGRGFCLNRRRALPTGRSLAVNLIATSAVYLHLSEKQKNSHEEEPSRGIKYKDTGKTFGRSSLEAGRVVGKHCSRVCLFLPLFAGRLLLATVSNKVMIPDWRHPSWALERAGFSPLLCHTLSVWPPLPFFGGKQKSERFPPFRGVETACAGLGKRLGMPGRASVCVRVGCRGAGLCWQTGTRGGQGAVARVPWPHSGWWWRWWGCSGTRLSTWPSARQR